MLDSGGRSRALICDGAGRKHEEAVVVVSPCLGGCDSSALSRGAPSGPLRRLYFPGTVAFASLTRGSSAGVIGPLGVSGRVSRRVSLSRPPHRRRRWVDRRVEAKQNWDGVLGRLLLFAIDSHLVLCSHVALPFARTASGRVDEWTPRVEFRFVHIILLLTGFRV